MDHKSRNKRKVQDNATQIPFHCFSPCIWYQTHYSLIRCFVYTTWLTKFLRNCFCFILGFFVHESVVEIFFFWRKNLHTQQFSTSFFSCVFVGIALKLMSLSYLLKILTKCKPILFGMWKMEMINGSSFLPGMFLTQQQRIFNIL